MSGQRLTRLLAVAVALGIPQAATAQLALAPGDLVAGALEPSDPRDAEGFVYDLYLLHEELGGRFVVTLESSEFDVVLEWGVVAEGGFRRLASIDDAVGLASPTDARLHLGLDGSRGTAVKVVSLDAGPDGSYSIRMEHGAVGAVGAAEPITVEYGEKLVGSLEESDALEGVDFHDLYRFPGRAGERALIGLEADFDAYLKLREIGPPAGRRFTYEDDDGFGGTDAFLEVDLPADGEYEILVTSYRQEWGDYELRIWDAPRLVRAIPEDLESLSAVAPETRLSDAEAARLLGLGFSDEERQGLTVVNGQMRNEAVGFGFPSPGPGFLPSEELAQQMGMSDSIPNVAAWTFTDATESTGIVVTGFKVPGPVTEQVFTFLVDNVSGSVRIQSVGGGEELFRQLKWEDERSFELGFLGEWEGEEGLGEIRCEASGPQRSPGLVVCLLAISSDGSSFIQAFRDLEIR